MWAKIVLNLVSNALKFTFNGGIDVRVTASDGHAELAVTDTGAGIDPSELPRLFERFHRIVGARSRTYEGSGIGLALVSELAELHGGDASVASTPGEGSTFTVRLPFGAEHLPADAVSEPSDDATLVERQAEGFLAEAMRWLEPSSEAVPGPVSGGPRILVVDDNADMREYISTLLADDYAIETAEDGLIALELARADPPDLVLTDVMMPNLDGFGLLAALQEDAATLAVPVVMLSARAGEEGTIEGLEAGADDYLIKPFSARELRARVQANLELDRARRTRDRLERSRALLDDAERLARIGSWEIELATGAITASTELARQFSMTPEELLAKGVEATIVEVVHPDDAARVRAALAAAGEGDPMDIEWRMPEAAGSVRTFRAIGELERDEEGRPVRLRGSNQDVTDQRLAEQTLAAVAGEREAAVRERAIADELQRRLMPEHEFAPEHLEVVTYYQPGEAGTQVGGDWFDVIELGAGRTALVVGDVMGRGVRAAAVMGQVRAAVRAYARLDLGPADVLELLDGVVRDLDPAQIVTCVYAVYDPRDRSLIYANAGHLPPLVVGPDGVSWRMPDIVGPPLGSGPFTLRDERAELATGARLALYTDGLVERRDRGLDAGIDALAGRLEAEDGPLDEALPQIIETLVADGTEDDVALLLASVPEAAQPADDGDVGRRRARRRARHATLRDRDARGLGRALRPGQRRRPDRQRDGHERDHPRGAAHRAAPAARRRRRARRGRRRRQQRAAPAAADARRRAWPRRPAHGHACRTLGHPTAARRQVGLVPPDVLALRRDVGCGTRAAWLRPTPGSTTTSTRCPPGRPTSAARSARSSMPPIPRCGRPSSAPSSPTSCSTGTSARCWPRATTSTCSSTTAASCPTPRAS